jgi:alpha-D-ribose 1-methylphosphonate 5-triphosphate diphosphatase
MTHPAFAAANLGQNDSATAPTLGGIRGNRVLTSDGFRSVHIGFNAERIGSIGSGDSRQASSGQGPCLDAGNLLVLPGIVDLHGDAFERSVMPRPGVSFGYDQAMHDVDRQLLSNGITTAFHGVTLSWEGGLRGAPYAQNMFDALQNNAELLGARHYVHLRFETHNLDDLGLACEWIADGRVRFLALNNHLPSMEKRLGNDRKLLQYAERAECDIDTFSSRIRAALDVTDAVPMAMRTLVRFALEAGIRVASHDDGDGEVRQALDALGCSVAEFPLTMDAVQMARQLGNHTVFGAPNVVRGGSHTNALDATEMVRTGLCDVLASDYYYPAQLAAAMKLDSIGAMPLARAWNLISANPAMAAGLDDRGVLSIGRYADAIVVDDSVAGAPRVCAAIVGSRLCYSNRHWTVLGQDSPWQDTPGQPSAAPAGVRSAANLEVSSATGGVVGTA